MTLVRLAWTRDQVAAFLAAPPAGARLAPLTPAAAGAALEARAPLAADPFELIDLRRDWAKLNAEAADRAAAALDRLAARRAARAAEPALAEPRLDRWLAYGWSRQIVHLEDALDGLAASIGRGCRFDLPDPAPPSDAAEARRRWFAALALQRIAGRAPEAPGALFASRPRAAGHFVAGPPDGPRLVVATFGLPDLPGLLARLRRTREHLVLLAETEYAHLDYLLARWSQIAARPGGATLISPDVAAPADRAAAFAHPRPPAGDAVEAIAEALAAQAWPKRAALWATCLRALGEGRLIRAYVSDHASDSGVAAAALARRWDAPLHVSAHSGLPTPAEFALPLARGDRGQIGVWTEERAGRLRRRLDAEGARLDVHVEPPGLFGRALATQAGALMRHAARVAGLRVGVFVTTGQDAFAPDRPVAPILAAFRTLATGAARRGMRLVVRLREIEDDPQLFLHGLDRATCAAIEFHRVGERGLSRALSAIDAAVELGCPTSASLVALARGVPVFRLGPHDYHAGDERGPALPVLRGADPAGALLAKVGDPIRRIREAVRLRALLWPRKSFGEVPAR